MTSGPNFHFVQHISRVGDDEVEGGSECFIPNMSGFYRLLMNLQNCTEAFKFITDLCVTVNTLFSFCALLSLTAVKTPGQVEWTRQSIGLNRAIECSVG